jgi:hypothetical protein
MLKSNIEIEGFIIGGHNAELLNLKVSYKSIIKEEKIERYIGIAEFEIKERLEVLDSFKIKGIDKNNKEVICITECKGLVEIAEKRYITNFDIENVEVSSIKDEGDNVQ